MIQAHTHWFLAAALAILISAAARHLRALSTSGFVAASLLGTTVVIAGGWWPGVILVVFFASSSLVSRPYRVDYAQVRGSRRNWIQVLANGWGLLIGCVLFATTSWVPWLLFGIGSICAATADTWSSEVGRTSHTPPRLITNLRVVQPGQSGAISARGTIAAILGAMLIASVTWVGVFTGALPIQMPGFLIISGLLLAGVVGGLVDSFLGATLQEQRYCDACQLLTESNPHRCGTATTHVTGITGFNNDIVNALCVLSGALLGLLSGILG